MPDRNKKVGIVSLKLIDYGFLVLDGYRSLIQQHNYNTIRYEVKSASGR